MQKEKILKLMLGKIGEMDISNLNAIDVLPYIGISAKQFTVLFPNGVEELFMDVIEYAGRWWLDCLKKDVKEMATKEEKIALLLNNYALGAWEYSENLSLYIDLWKLIKDGKSNYLKMRLWNIYDIYIKEFSVIIREIGVSGLTDEEIHVMGVIMTAMSDAIHIQSLTMESPVDFAKIQDFICKSAKIVMTSLRQGEEKHEG